MGDNNSNSNRNNNWRGRKSNWTNRNKWKKKNDGVGFMPRPEPPPPPRTTNAAKKPRLEIKEKIDESIMMQLIKIYPGYILYFSTSLSSIPQLIDKIGYSINYLERNSFVTSLSRALYFEERKCFELVYEDLLDDVDLLEDWKSLNEDLEQFTDDFLKIWGIAMHTIISRTIERSQDEDENVMDNEMETIKEPYKCCFIETRLLRMRPLVPLKNLSGGEFPNKFVTVCGTIVKISPLRPYIIQFAFYCSDCSAVFGVHQIDGHFTQPKECSNEGCKSKKFTVLEEHSLTLSKEFRKVFIQEIHFKENGEQGKVPNTVCCFFFDDLAKSCNPGDNVTLSGILKSKKESSGGSGLNFDANDKYIKCLSIKNHKDLEQTMGGHIFSFTQKDFYAVKEIYNCPSIFRLLVASFCPTIYGHDLVKAGILLSLFGGTPSELTRSEINTLIVGDPGLGKSQLLTAVTLTAPRCVYVCGTSSTTAGLTVTMIKDGDDYTLEAGALVLADHGVCCIDEFDKMESQHHALLEAMEQQSVSIAKGGMFRKIPARTAVIAAANPVGGSYNHAKSISENIKIRSALLSRFDLKFILVDRPDSIHDNQIVDHIISRRSKNGLIFKTNDVSSDNLDDESFESRNTTLKDRLKVDVNEQIDKVPHRLIRKYIAYARQYVRPNLSLEAKTVLKNYYLKLRSENRSVDSPAVTTRQLESLIRLTQARAMLELRELATEEDANEILEIFEFGMTDFSRHNDFVGRNLNHLTNLMGPTSKTGSRPQGTKGKAKRLIAALKDCAQLENKKTFTLMDIKAVGSRTGLQESDISALVSILNNDGFLLSRGGGKYELTY